MSDQPCEHLVLSDLTGSTPSARVRVVRCDQHSLPKAGITAWVWSARALPSQCCPCEIADRFFVVTDQASLQLIHKADVVQGPTQTTMRDALRIAERLGGLPGYALITVSAGRHGTVFRTRTQQVVLAAHQSGPQVCGMCLYPWLAVGHCLDELAERLPASSSVQRLATGRTP